jgi:hypothetical protein
MSPEAADALGWIDATCRFCGLLFSMFHPTEDDVHLPVCDPCKRAGRGEGCEDPNIYPLSRGD